MAEKRVDPLCKEELMESSIKRSSSNKHWFINVDEEKSMDQESKLKAIQEMIGNSTLSEQTRTIIIVNGIDKFVLLTDALTKSGHKYASVTRGMNQHEIDRVVKEFLDNYYLLITTELGRGNMSSEYFDSSVYSIIYYDCPKFEDYTRYLGWFRNVSIGVTFTCQEDMSTLLTIQETHGVIFERMLPSELFVATHSEKSLELSGSSHWVEMVESNSIKLFHLQQMNRIFLAAGRISVIFVESAKYVERVVKKMDKLFDIHEQVPIVTGNFTEVEANAYGRGSSCVFVTCDDAIRREFEPRLNRIKEFVNVVINYDSPMNEDAYISRCGLCRSDGVIIHFATHLDWLKIFGIQNKIANPLKKFKEHVIVDHLLRLNPVG